MRRGEHHERRFSRFFCFLPTPSTQTPAITRLEPRKTVLRHRRRQVIPAALRERQEISRHNRAYRVRTDVFSPGITTTVAEKPRHRSLRTYRQRTTENITGRGFHDTLHASHTTICAVATKKFTIKLMMSTIRAKHSPFRELFGTNGIDEHLANTSIFRGTSSCYSTRHGLCRRPKPSQGRRR